MKFTKMQGCGNDYVYINCLSENVKDAGSLARRVSDRHFSIGSDGLILIKESKIADFIMEMYNVDGTQGEMCGNAIRCVGKYVFDHGLTNKNELKIETLGGIKTLYLNISDSKVDSVRVDMEIPSLVPEKVPIITPNGMKLAFDVPIKAAGNMYEITGISMGNPHGVVFVDDVDALDLKVIGPEFECNVVFPERANIEFVELLDRNNIKMRVWERGSAETWACGTGACASALSSILHGFCNNTVTVHMRGGELRIEYAEEDGRIWMTGPATETFNGEIDV